MLLSKTFIYIATVISLIGFVIGLWGVFKKAGRSTWHSLIPIYNMWAWLCVIGRPWWWMLFILCPVIGVFMFFLMIWKTIHLFGKHDYLHLLLGTAFFFVYLPYLGFSKKEKFTPYDPSQKIKKSAAREWGDAIIFAVAAAWLIRTFMVEFYAIPTSSMESSLMVGDYLAVGKMDYGARIPMTPLAVPFVHHTLPLTDYTKSYVEWISCPFMKFPALNPLQRNDVVVFNYPDGDTVALERQSESYYAIVREFETMLNPQSDPNELRRIAFKYGDAITALQAQFGGTYYPGKGREVVKQVYHVTARPVDKRENYVKRCVALPGDELTIINGQLYINGQTAYNPERMQYTYYVHDPAGIGLTSKQRKELNINEEDWWKQDNATAIYCLHKEQINKIKKSGKEVTPNFDKENQYDSSIFPHDKRYAWNKDNFGPFVIPAKGVTVPLNDSTIVLYDKIIVNYEHNTLEIKGKDIYVNGEKTTEYTFQMNYYFMMGDNRHNSADSRFWGVVPEDHIVGKPLFVWLSLDKFKSWSENKIRWNRMFKTIK